MASLIAQYRQIIEKILQDYADFLDTDRQIQIELVLDQKRDRHFVAHKQSFLQLGKTTETMYLISPILRK